MRGSPDVASILLVDWPSREVPESLTRAGYRVTLKGAPGEGEYSGYEIANGHVRAPRMQPRPAHVDLVYVHRVDRHPGWGPSRHRGLTPPVVRKVLPVWGCCRSCATPW
jgi:hypothetical protein